MQDLCDVNATPRTQITKKTIGIGIMWIIFNYNEESFKVPPNGETKRSYFRIKKKIH